MVPTLMQSTECSLKKKCIDNYFYGVFEIFYSSILGLIFDSFFFCKNYL